MATAPPSTFLTEILDFLASTPTPQDIIDYQPSPELVELSHYLHAQNREELLTDVERVEFEELRRMNHFMNQLKVRAQLKLRESTDE